MFANNLRYLREKHGMDQIDLAMKLGRKSSSSVSEWEKGKYTPKIGVLNDIAEIFGVSITDLMNKDLSHAVDNRVNLIRMYDSLNGERQNKVYNFAKQQYNEQKNVIQMPVKSEVKLYGAVSAGTGEYLLDNTPELVPYEGVVPEHDYAVIVNGVSMRPLFEDKQIIFVKKTFEARSGQVVIAYYDNQAYVKKYVNDEKGARFVSLNKSYDDMPIDETHETQIIGVVVL
ncbi:XRE family transcriptional regulator [Leuconostoc citreum]|uniref:XRE family transcriptional regulator n=1 Tax=Leuconostoc citreum TaxID=33964 RepID=UPI0021A322C7|nr:XRE family transcriptional regulator [Leuconostoc citreum]MCT3078244.1 LexA family transcriptional regulator [Leuconostoc citreum]MCT3080459.1 LexA family transcriptional regulator [Leuconostoc citreum]MCT3082886.1 LexA family transcriptional regulator [Leuconostoc citreum]